MLTMIVSDGCLRVNEEHAPDSDEILQNELVHRLGGMGHKHPAFKVHLRARNGVVVSKEMIKDRIEQR